MATRYASYSMKDGSTRLGQDYFNPIFKDLDTRLDKMENLRISWETAVQDLNAFGLERIDTTIAPVLAAAQELLQQGQASSDQLQQLIEDADIQGQLDAALDAQSAAVTSELEAQNTAIISELDAIETALSVSIAAVNVTLSNRITALETELETLRPLIFAGL